MSSVISSLPPPPMPPFPVRRFTVAEYEQLARVGILTEEDNVELLQGWIVPKMVKNPPHDGTIDLIQFLVGQMLPVGWFLRVQNVVITPDSAPEPDLALVRGQPGDYRQRHPTGTDVALVIEVADTTLARDRLKASIYARAGIPWYWIVDVEHQQVEVCSQPGNASAAMGYQSREVCRGDNRLQVFLNEQAIGDLSVSDVLA